MKKLTILILLLSSMRVHSQNIINGEYFFDTDPGIGLATPFPTSITPADSIELTLTIPASGLSTGLHVLYLRTQNDSGVWSLSEPRMLNVVSSNGQGLISQAEYFFDTDPGVGLGTALSVGTVADSVEFSPSISAGAILPGLHVLYIRTRNTDGVWSLSEPRMINVIPNSGNTNIVSAEYFFDTDPGIGQGTALITGAPADSVEFMPAIATGSLSPGLHVLYIRTKNSGGVWSLSEPRLLNVIPAQVNGNIVAGEYFIDTDPGVGQATPFSTGAPADSIEVITSVSFSSLTVDSHFVYMRTKNSSGVWSLSEPRKIQVWPCLPSAQILTPSDTLTFCQGAPVNVSADTTGAFGYLWSTGDTTATIQLDTAGLITVEVFDSFGCSETDSIFSNMGTAPVLSGCADISVNNDAGLCSSLVNYSGITGSGNPQPSITYSQPSGSAFPSGNSAVTVYATNNCAVDSCLFNVTVLDAETPLVNAPADVTVALGTGNCVATGVNLGTLIESDNCSIASSTNDAPANFQVGNTLVTYTVTDVNGHTTQVTQNVTVTGNINFNLSFTASQTTYATLPATVTFTNNTPNLSQYSFVWDFGDGLSYAGNNATVTHTYVFNGQYSVTLMATNNAYGCSDTLEREEYIEVNAPGGPGCNHQSTVNPGPTVNACVGNTVQLNGSTNISNATFNWYRNGIMIGGANQPTYLASQPGSYKLRVFDANSCPVTSAPTIISYGNPAPTPPVITATGTPGPCLNVNLVLTASGGSGSYLWSTGSSGPVITVTQGGTYTVTAISGNCNATSLPYNIVGSHATVPPICMITIDTLINKNVLVWEQTGDPEVNSYIIYRQDSLNPAQYDSIASVSDTLLSEYYDMQSYPNAGAYRYKLAIADDCGGISLPSPAQKSMHLSVTQGNSILHRHLSWNTYEGQPQSFSHYLIFRQDSPGVLSLLDSVPYTQAWYYDTTIPTLQDTGRAYMVGYRIGGCTSSRASRNICNSNLTSPLRKLIVVDEIRELDGLNFSVNIFPNPNKGKFVIRFSGNISQGNGRMLVYNLPGEKVYATNLTMLRQQEIDLGVLAEGVYMAEFSDGTHTLTRKLVITR